MIIFDQENLVHFSVPESILRKIKVLFYYFIRKCNPMEQELKKKKKNEIEWKKS